MKHYSIVLVFLAMMMNGQNRRFFYEYRYAPDSTRRDSVLTEQMCLEVGKTGSKFYSYTVYRSDSLMKINLENQLKMTGAINIKNSDRKGNIRNSVTKNYPEYSTYLHAGIFTDKYRIEEDRPMEWKVIPEKQKTGHFNTQRAETDFAGRHWIAWFTEEIPIQDGPYKFHGLPGLIVKISDSDGSHQFTLQEIKDTGNKDTDYNVFTGKEIEVTQKQYNKLLKEYENDPTKGLKQMSMGNIVMKMDSSAETARWMKDRERQLKENIRKNNNRIELN
ncbi:GLPGLI family protein [Weeksellaceae bacterium A-14]